MSGIKMVAFAASRQVCLLSLVVLLAAGVCFGKPAVSLSLTSGPPTSKLLVSGSGFTPYAEIDIYFDSQDEAKATANGSGSFSNISIQAPASALPGRHRVRAVQRSGQLKAQAPFLVNTNWSQFGFRPDGTRYNPYENVLTPSTVGSLGLLWSYTTGGAVPFSPAVAHGVVYAGSDDGNLYALNAMTGAKLWSYGASASPAVWNGAVYLPIFALNDSTGALQWTYSGGPGDVGGSPLTIANGVVYAGGYDDDYAVNASDGTQVWVAHWGYRTASSVAYANETIYLCNEVLYALESATGSGPGGLPLWSSGCSDSKSSPAVADGVVYVGWGNVMDALNATTGALLWTYPTGNTIEGPPAVANGVVYIGSDDNNLYALNANTGALLWSYTTGGFVTSAPAVANGVVYVGSDDNKLYALNATTGALLWSYTTGGVVESSPAVSNGVVYVGSDDGKVYAFGLTGGGSANPTVLSASPSSGPPSRNIAPPSSYIPSPANNVPSIASFDQAPPASGSIGFAQVAAAIAHSTKASVVYSSAQTAGDLNVVVVGWNDAVATISSVTDTRGNTYSLAIGPTRGTVLSQSIYYAKNIAGAAAGTNTVVVTFNQAPLSPVDVRILEYKGVSTTSPLDVTAGNFGTSSSPNSGSKTTTAANELIFGADTAVTATTIPGPNFTSRIITAAGNIAEDEIVSAMGSYSASATLGSSGNWVIQMATFKATSAGSISFVQVNNIIENSTSVSLVYSNAQTAGNMNLVVVGWNDAVATVSSVTDTKGNTYSLAIGPTRGTALSQSIYYAKNIAGAAAATNTVVVKFNQVPIIPDIRILEYSGLSTTSPLDVTAGASNNSSNTNSGSAVTTAANELIFGANTVYTGTTGPGSGFTSRIITAAGDIAEDQIVSAIGSYSASAPLGSSGPWVMQMATFEAPVITSGAPTVISVSPSSGTDNGGTSVTITGTNFVSGASATFGGTDAINTTVVNSTTITATTRPAAAGAVTVLVTNPNGQSGSLSNGYTYTANPTLTSVSPSFGSVSGGTSVTITGTNFASGATVTFGTTAATNVKFVSSTSITATTPAQVAGGANVVVTNSSGLSGTLTNGFVYNANASTIKFVQVAAATPQTPMTSVSVTYPSAQTAGDLNVVVVGWNDTIASVKSVTDSHGNTYTLAVGPVLGTNLSQSIYYSKNIASGSSNTVTATFSQAAVAVDLRVLEYSGADPQNPLDATAFATGNSSTTSSGSAPTNAANELVVAANTVYTGTSGPGAGFTKRIITSDGDLVEDEIVSTAGTYGATAPLGSSGNWVMQLVTFTPVQLPATGPLKVSANPLYFANASGTPIYLTGAHTWPNNKDGWGIPGGTCPPPQFNWTGYLNYVQSYRFSYIRLWTWELPTSLSEPDNQLLNECHLPLPFLRSGPGFATDGQLKFDLTQFNQAFFDRLRQRVIQAGQAGVYVSIMLFDGYGLVHRRVATDGYWFTGANNINGVDDGYSSGASGYNSQNLLYSGIGEITPYQNAYVEKVIDTVNDLPNVLYEIANEANLSSTTWEESMITLIHSYEAGKPYQHPVGFTCNSDQSLPPVYWGSAADYVAPCGGSSNGNDAGYSYPVYETSTNDDGYSTKTNKVVIDDTDHTWPWSTTPGLQAATTADPAAQRNWVWENFTRGSSTAFMDPYLVVWPVRNCPADPAGGIGEPSGICGTVTNNYATTPDPYYSAIRTAMSQTATYSRQINLANMTPQNSLCSTTFCLVSAGQQYLVYWPGPGTVTTSGTTVTWAAGGPFSTAWAKGTEILINGSPFYLASVPTSTTSLTVTVAPPTYSKPVPYSVPSVPVTVTLTAGTYNYQWFTAGAVASTGSIVATGSYSFTPPSIPALTLTAAANASGGTTVYSGTIPGGGSNAYVGFQFVVTGFDKSANNGTFTCIDSSTTTLTLINAAGVSDTHGATATGVGDAVLLLTIN